MCYNTHVLQYVLQKYVLQKFAINCLGSECYHNNSDIFKVSIDKSSGTETGKEEI